MCPCATKSRLLRCGDTVCSVLSTFVPCATKASVATQLYALLRRQAPRCCPFVHCVPGPCRQLLGQSVDCCVYQCSVATMVWRTCAATCTEKQDLCTEPAAVPQEQMSITMHETVMIIASLQCPPSSRAQVPPRRRADGPVQLRGLTLSIASLLTWNHVLLTYLSDLHPITQATCHCAVFLR